MDRTTISVTFIVGGFFVLLLTVFFLSLFVPSLQFVPPRPQADAGHDASFYNSEEQTGDSLTVDTPPGRPNETQPVIEVRVCSRNIQTIRSGPGPEYSESASSSLKKGQEVYVIEERNGWVKVRTTPDDGAPCGWIRKDATVSERQFRLPASDGTLTKWMRSGLLLNVDPGSNTAAVNTKAWTVLDTETRQIVARAIAAYFALHNKNDEMWCHIADGTSGKKIATYTDQGGLSESR